MKKLLLILLLIPNLVIGEGGGYVPGQSMKEYFESSDLPPLEGPESWKERQREYKVYQDEQQRLREKKQRDITSKSYINSIKDPHDNPHNMHSPGLEGNKNRSSIENVMTQA